MASSRALITRVAGLLCVGGLIYAPAGGAQRAVIPPNANPQGLVAPGGSQRGFDPGQFPNDLQPQPEPEPEPQPQPQPVPPGCADQVSVPSGVAEGLVDIAIVNPCRQGQAVRITGDDLDYEFQFDGQGRAKAQVPIFRESGRITWQQADGSSSARSVAFMGIRDAFKIALVWTTKVELALHVLEPSALFQGANSDVYRDGQSGRSSDGYGRIQFYSRARSAGINIDLYSLPMQRNPRRGILPFHVDFVSRGKQAAPPYCQGSDLAAPAFEIWVLRYGKLEKRTNQRFGAAPCGTVFSVPAYMRGEATLTP